MRLRKTIGLSLVLLVASVPAMAKAPLGGHHHPEPHHKAKPHKAEAEAKGSAKRHRVSHGVGHRVGHGVGHKVAVRTARRRRVSERRHVAALPPPDRFIGGLRAVGRPQIGSAAWYGGRHIGRRTASGEPLDDVHVTAAHRSLPLYSLVRVTNLNNGRSVIATINDRGPVSRRLLIDLSPRAAEDLDMIRAGIARVSIEPVVRTARRPREPGR